MSFISALLYLLKRSKAIWIELAFRTNAVVSSAQYITRLYGKSLTLVYAFEEKRLAYRNEERLHS